MAKNLLIHFFIVLFGVRAFATEGPQKELRWNWDEIDTDAVYFPEHFQFCAATSEYQLSGSGCDKKADCAESNWSRYEKQKKWWGWGGPVIESSGDGIGHWDHFKEDVGLIKQLGVTVYRCSIEWARVQPRKGYYDPAVIKHYHDLFDECRKQGLTVMATLHHFVNPAWFEDEGAFEKEKSIWYLVEFAKRMFIEYHEKVAYWCTINEPGVYAAQTYIMHDFPQPEKSNLSFPCGWFGPCAYGAAIVTKHLMMAHVEIYKALKALPGGDKAQIGIVHQIVHFEPYYPGNWFETTLTDMLNHVYHRPITQFLITGELEYNTFTDTIKYSYPDIRNVQDFVGINYYSHVLLKWSNPSGPQFRPEDGEVPTDMYYGTYAEGLYRVAKELAPIGKPIFVTENGLADAKDDRRDTWYRRYLYALSEAIQEGIDVRMFCAWSSFDNFEWNLGYGPQFGLISVNRTTYERTVKQGAEYFRELAHKQAGVPYKRIAPLPQQQEVEKQKSESKDEL